MRVKQLIKFVIEIAIEYSLFYFPFTLRQRKHSPGISGKAFSVLPICHLPPLGRAVFNALAIPCGCFLSIPFKSADEVLDDISPDHLEALKTENVRYLRNLELQHGLKPGQKVMTGCQEGLPVQAIKNMQFGKGLVENELVGPRYVKLRFSLMKVPLACIDLFKKLLSQTFWIPIPVSLFHFLTSNDSALRQVRRQSFKRTALVMASIRIVFDSGGMNLRMALREWKIPQSFCRGTFCKRLLIVHLRRLD